MNQIPLSQTPTSSTDRLQEQATSALLHLGYRTSEIKTALTHALAKIGPAYELEDLIRTGLKELAKS